MIYLDTSAVLRALLGTGGNRCLNGAHGTARTRAKSWASRRGGRSTVSA